MNGHSSSGVASDFESRNPGSPTKMVEFRRSTMGRRLLRRLVSEAARWGQRRLRDCLPDRVVLARRYRRTFAQALDLRNPRTFNEKLYWLMLCRGHAVTGCGSA
jgi:hypothetical protein